MSLPVARPEEIGLDPRRLQIAFDLLARWTNGPSPAIPGGALLIGRQGKIAEPRFFGRQGAEAGAPPIRRDGIFLLASLTKPITYLAGMMLVERGLLNLSDPVTRYIPDFAAHHKEQTLVQHLFTHTSGLPDMLDNNLELRKQQAPLDKFIAGAIRDTVPKFPPGTGYSYQSMGTLVVAQLVQQLSGMTIHAFLKQEIFEPLGLQHIALGSRGLDKTRLVRVREPAGQESAWSWNSDYWRELGAPWGGLFSTPEDFAVLCQLMLNGGAFGGVRLLAPATVRRITTNRMDDLPELPESIRRTRPWGLGWWLNHPADSHTLCDLLGTQAYGHLGATGTLFWVDPVSTAFALVFTTEPRDSQPGRLVALSNALAAAVV